MGHRRNKNIAYVKRLVVLKKRGLEFFQRKAKIPCDCCGRITKVHSYGKSKEVIRYACWNERCPDYGIEKSMFNCHQEIKKYLEV